MLEFIVLGKIVDAFKIILFFVFLQIRKKSGKKQSVMLFENEYIFAQNILRVSSVQNFAQWCEKVSNELEGLNRCTRLINYR